MGRLPAVGVGYSGADYQFWGAGLRDVIQVGPNLRIDLGGRFDGANYKQVANQYADPNFQTPNNPQDVDPATVTPQFTNPSVFQPRIGFSYQITKNTSLRAEFARTTNLIPGQGFGTPFRTYPADQPRAAVDPRDRHRSESRVADRAQIRVVSTSARIMRSNSTGRPIKSMRLTSAARCLRSSATTT